MKKETYQVIGLMSGTSLDGLDIAACEFHLNNHQWQYKFLSTNTVTYDSDLMNQLKQAIRMNGYDLYQLDIKLGNFFGEATRKFILKNNLSPDLIASHGHTIFHQPEKRLTVQIGNGLEIHRICQVPVINNFRELDVLLGGQGAPLVPIGDHLLFCEYDFCLNLGGISNISYVNKNNRTAFDIAPNNIVFNQLARQLGSEYDKGGNLGKTGKKDKDLLEALNKLNYYQLPHPKSLGIEWIEEEVFTVLEKSNCPTGDQLTTFYHHAAYQVAEVINRNSRGKKSVKVLVTGGGAYNTYFIQLLKSYVNDHIVIEVPEPGLVEFKEALIFAFLGVLRIRKDNNVLKDVTGAHIDHSGGVIYDNLRKDN